MLGNSGEAPRTISNITCLFLSLLSTFAISRWEPIYLHAKYALETLDLRIRRTNNCYLFGATLQIRWAPFAFALRSRRSKDREPFKTIACYY